MSQIKKTPISTTIAAAAFGAVFVAGPAMAYKGTPDDFIQIFQLFAQYSQDFNTGDGDALAMDFTPDAVFQVPGDCLIGRTAIAEKLGGHHPGGIPGKDLKNFHTASLGPITYQDKDHATAHSYVEIFKQDGGPKAAPGEVTTTGTYDDKLVRYNGEWKFAYRFVQRAWPTPPVPCAPQKENGFKWGQLPNN